MAKKRKSSEMVPHTTPEARRQQKPMELSHDLAQFCHDAGIALPIDDRISPAKDQNGIGHKIVGSYRLLWWKNKPALEIAINQFFRSLPSTPNSTSEFVKLELIYEALRGPAEMAKNQSMTPRTARIVENAFEPMQADPPSPSPTPAKTKGKGIKGHFTATKSVAKGPRDDGTSVYYSAKTSMAPPAADTSFTTAATKSFDGLFQSSPRQATQDTAATSFSDMSTSPRRRESNYLSSLSTTECGELMNKLEEVESSQKSKATDKTARPTLPLFAPSTQSLRDTETTWGSSLDTSAYEEGQKDVDQFIANGYYWQKRDSGVVSEEEFETADEHIESPKRQKLSTKLQTCPENAADTEPAQFRPSHGFAQLQLPGVFSSLPFYIQWEAQRLLQAQIVTPQRLLDQWRTKSLQELYQIASQQEKPFSRAFNAEHPDYQDMTFTGKLQFAVSSNGVLFDMKLQYPSKGTTSDLQRRFGSERILYVDMPSLNKPPAFLKGKNLMRRFEEMAETPQTFLGRRWFLLLTQAHKKRKKSDLAVTKPGASRLVFVAIDHETTLHDVVSYVVPHRENAKQAARKLYSRFELVVSASKPAVAFQPKDIDYGVEDQRATSDPADNRFLDPALMQYFYEPEVSAREMSDGCCEMSLSTAREVATALGRTDMPSAVQCRIAGSKGIWYRRLRQAGHTDEHDECPSHHIKIARTQIKVLRDSLLDCDPGTLVLNVLKANSPARRSLLHIGFLPILLDRGVPREAIFQPIRENIQRHFEELHMALKSTKPTPLRRWMHAQNEIWEERSRSGGIRTLAGFPQAREERIVQLLEAGFVPSQDAFLAGEVQAMVEHWLDVTRKNFKIPLGRSTTLMGMADPTGTLEPGEVHVNFSAPFRDHVTGEVRSLLTGEGLVARNPAMAPWDMQKVRFVFCSELADLPDMIIFSAKGKRPLAELLQGGDYDGDTFWVCWEPKLVAPFKNAPAPWGPPQIDFFGIDKDRQTLRDFVTDPRSESQWCHFFSEMAVTRIRFNLLGTVTRLHECLVYLEGGINSEMAIYLVHLHDYLVDAEKQGYNFDEAAFRRFKEKIKLPKNLPRPLHWAFTKIDDDDDERNNMRAPIVEGNVIDDVFLKIVKPKADEAMHRVKQVLFPARQFMDPHLGKFLEETITSAHKGSLIRRELKAIERPLEDIRQVWKTHQRVWGFNELVLRLRTKYDAITPHDTLHPTVVEWMRKQGNDLTIWEKLKACVFAKLHHGTLQRGRLVFSVAGRDLCIIKHHEVGPSHAVTEEAWCNFKISNKPREIEELVDDDDEPDAGEADAVDQDDDDGFQVVQQPAGYF
ncbi:hypothetical protein M409DRAFT_21720 [Zasmidium cellare ATCC 36951]|uniref:RNA-dependent RNA polymerase n=1 Tax=Zasmidium cellare ATCC 36951 TaxID=1080233 RepID=A0A6A6CR31_ZASCE|nr:uncharacterized protein M409DRAFT_21720 [Zasmidium cellare ATCC 36951]KAF2168282.1 hypothetical protein M409DRAFT_21720 [Zasmidium cellare ATCC 36951]